jgi:glycosyltransferase involved in cell wall biosynthesis
VVPADAISRSAVKRLRIAINAQLRPGAGSGGVESVLRVLTGLAHLDGPEQYLFVVLRDHADWLRPLLDGATASIVTHRLPILERVLHLAHRLARHRPAPLKADGNFFDALHCDVVHFPYQVFHRTAAPSVFNPHDLQHLHYPQFFSEDELRDRNTIYEAACRSAHTVAVASEFVKRDVVAQYGLDPAKVRAIPWAPLPIPSVEGPLSRKSFALYPAMLWEHKNHLRLLDAVALLRDTRGLRIPVVCTGFKGDHWPAIESRLTALRLQDQITFPGVVTDEALATLYRQAQFVVIPSLFEAASAPMFEAWQHRVPVACSDSTALPEQAHDAALLFDPMSVPAIAAAMEQMATDASLRETLVERGTHRLGELDPIVTLKRYRAVYRQAAGQELIDEDRWLLDGT